MYVEIQTCKTLRIDSARPVRRKQVVGLLSEFRRDTSILKRYHAIPSLGPLRWSCHQRSRCFRTVRLEQKRSANLILLRYSIGLRCPQLFPSDVLFRNRRGPRARDSRCEGTERRRRENLLIAHEFVAESQVMAPS